MVSDIVRLDLPDVAPVDHSRWYRSRLDEPHKPRCGVSAVVVVVVPHGGPSARCRSLGTGGSLPRSVSAPTRRAAVAGSSTRLAGVLRPAPVRTGQGRVWLVVLPGEGFGGPGGPLRSRSAVSGTGTAISGRRCPCPCVWRVRRVCCYSGLYRRLARFLVPVRARLWSAPPGSCRCSLIRRADPACRSVPPRASWGRSTRPTRRSTGTRRVGCASGPAANTWCEPGRKCASRPCGSGKSTGSRALDRERRAFRGGRHDLVREPDAGDSHVWFDERRLETELWRGVRHRHGRKPPGPACPRLPPPRQSLTVRDPERVLPGSCERRPRLVGVRCRWLQEDVFESVESFVDSAVFFPAFFSCLGEARVHVSSKICESSVYIGSQIRDSSVR